MLRMSWQKHRQQEMVFFATDRAPSRSGFYGGTRDTLQFGYALVSLEYYLPRSGLPQEVPLSPRGRRVISRMESTQRFRLDSIVAVPESTFYALVQRSYSPSAGLPPQDTMVIVFIHGYNVDFADAIERTANLRYRTNANAGIAYSWPSRGKLLQYVTDLDQARWTAPHLAGFLNRLVRQVDGKYVNVVVHSMGTQALAQAVELSSMSGSSPAVRLPLDARNNSKTLRSITFVNPDFDQELFFRDAVPMFGSLAGRMTLYGTPRDIPLYLAAFLRSGYPRAGQVRGNVMECPVTLDCVDVTPALKGLGLNHFEILTPNSPITDDFARAAVAADPASCRAAMGTYEQKGTIWVMLREPAGFDPADLPESCHAYGQQHQISFPTTRTREATVRFITNVFARRFGGATIENDSTLIQSEVVEVGGRYMMFEAHIRLVANGFLIRIGANVASLRSGFEPGGTFTMISDAPHWAAEWNLVRELADELTEILRRDGRG